MKTLEILRFTNAHDTRYRGHDKAQNAPEKINMKKGKCKKMIYAAVYTGKREVWPIDEKMLKQLGKTHPGRDPLFTYYQTGKGHFGTIFNASQLFTSEAEAWNDWNREPHAKGAFWDYTTALNK